MGEHIEDQSAAGGFTIIPARPLRRVEHTVEYPPAEIEPDRENAAKEVCIKELAEPFDARQKQFALNYPVLQPGALRPARQLEGVGNGLRDRLFEINMLARVQRAAGARVPPAGRRCIEIDRDVAVTEKDVPIGAPFKA